MGLVFETKVGLGILVPLQTAVHKGFVEVEDKCGPGGGLGRQQEGSAMSLLGGGDNSRRLGELTDFRRLVKQLHLLNTEVGLRLGLWKDRSMGRVG